jgi:hypothetical protein
MESRFMGLGDMSREDQMRVGLIAVLVLSLECVLEGLVAEAPLRAWIFHAVAVGFAVWSLFDMSPWVVRTASAMGVVAVGNEALLISEASASMRFLIPASVLFVASGWVFQRSIASTVAPNAYESSGDYLTAPDALGFNLPLAYSPLRTYSPVVIGVGALLSLYGLFVASWAQANSFFGLLENQLTLSEVRASWSDLGAPSGFFEIAASGVQILSVLALLVSAVGAVGTISRQFSIPHQFIIGGTAVISVVLGLQILIIAGITSAEGDVRVLTGAWIAPLGLATVGVGYWFSRES